MHFLHICVTMVRVIGENPIDPLKTRLKGFAMLLAVSPSAKALRTLKKALFSHHCFALYAFSDKLLETAALFPPKALLLLYCTLDEEMCRSLSAFKKQYPKAEVIWVGKEPLKKRSALLDSVFIYPARLSYKTLLTKLFSLNPARPDGSLLTKGLYLSPREKLTAIYGRPVSFSLSHVSVLRLLSEASPRHLSAEEIARLSSFPDEPLTAASIVSRISRLNSCVKLAYALPRRLVQKDETGYFIAP